MDNSLLTKARAIFRAAVGAKEKPSKAGEALRQALSQNDLRAVVPSAELEKYLAGRNNSRVEARDLFTMDGKLLPCWLESDLDPADPWLTSSESYPLYHSLFRHLTSERQSARLLEIGVRTGYVASVFAQAAACRCFYLGIDPNIYIPNGLDLAGRSLRILRNKRTNFEYALLEGYSSDQHFQKSISHAGPYELVHIDGDHSLPGKLLDLYFASTVTAPDGVVLVDDYDHHGPVVQESIRRAVALGWFEEFAYIPSHRGLGVLRKR